MYSIGLTAQVTFTSDIADIIYNKCSTCHRPGEIGPFSLTNYDEVVAYGPTIKFVTQSKYMPPWKADPNYQHYIDENYLTDDQIKMIGDWVDSGAPYGNATEEPNFPDFPTGSAIGEPDLVLSFAESHLHKGNNKDEYRYFVLPSGLLEDKKLKAIELRPGNSRIVHHALFFQDVTGKAAQFDAATAEYGFLGTAGFDTDAVLNYDQYPGFVPGQRARYFPDGMAQTMKAGADLVIQMHYAPFSSDEIDSSSVNLFFADETEVIDREVQDEIMLPFNLPGGFFAFTIPANQTKEFVGKWKLNQDLSFIGVFPHMHLLGKAWEVYIEKPDGSVENLIKIDDWDFNWQGGYYFKKFITASKGSTVIAKAVYDNTIDNPNNPSNPPRTVRWGENTTDEMYYLPLLYVPYKQGDEDIIFDETSTDVYDIFEDDQAGISIYPNPSDGRMINVGFNLKMATKVNISLLDLKGQLVRQIREGEFFNKGVNFTHINANTLSNGVYLLRIEGSNIDLAKQIIIAK